MSWRVQPLTGKAACALWDGESMTAAMQQHRLSIAEEAPTASLKDLSAAQ